MEIMIVGEGWDLDDLMVNAKLILSMEVSWIYMLSLHAILCSCITHVWVIFLKEMAL